MSGQFLLLPLPLLSLSRKKLEAKREVYLRRKEEDSYLSKRRRSL